MKNKTNNLLDNCIRNDLKIIEKDLMVGMIGMAAIFVLGLSWFIIFLGIPVALLMFWYIWKLYTRLFCDFIFGKDAALYQSLPIPANYLVLSKIYSGALVFLLLAASGFLGYVMSSIFNGELMNNLTELYNGIDLMLAVKLLGAVLFVCAVTAVVLAAVTVYKTMPEQAQNHLVNHSVTVICLCVVTLLAVVPAGFNLLTNSVVLAAAYKTAVKRLDEKFRIV